MLYLKLFHGREEIDQEMNDWGEEGPVIGPLEYVHTTYGSEIKIAEAGAFDADLVLEVVDGCVKFNDMYYGDWSAFVSNDVPDGATTLADLTAD